ncbi:hypothetical protein J2T02_002920 [Chitinophaga terrae (ex Kim and Jung 2007)]|uniref:DUF4296 domain-containing protein n=1 Tax=Chitinophaga terrae (ex Kim and Jung 2007) TaxID=408074 RepID=UPI002788B7BB|nr:DUF4296 domain-containing protein [Chitinophaga terrae (ex Kim and Jung 2007)]MDQ0107799.1 hypothetical protein [Chitinophaga terrae (ex Kim and Jung 2007)]
MKNILKYAIVALAGVLLFACGDGENVPKKYMSKEEMSAILRDMSIADSYGNEQIMNNFHIINDSLRQNTQKVYYKQVLDLHKVTVPQFMESYQYYEAHPNRLKEVLQMVQADLEARKQRLGDPVDENAPVRFRLRNIFPNADSIMLLPKSDTVIPFVKRHPNI